MQDELRALVAREHARLEREGNLATAPAHPVPAHTALPAADMPGTSEPKLWKQQWGEETETLVYLTLLGEAPISTAYYDYRNCYSSGYTVCY